MAQVDYRVLIVRPDLYLHVAALYELAESLYFGLVRAGYRASLEGPVIPGEQVIVLGAHLVDAADPIPCPTGTIIYNTEQMSDESAWRTSHYLGLLKAYQVWDYSVRNVERLEALGVTRVTHVPVGYVPELARIQSVEEDIDVLFYGSLNERRQCILDELRQRGLEVVAVFGVYGAERDDLIARAKVVINIHYYESKIFEIVRVSYLLINQKAVVAECGLDTEMDQSLRRSVLGVSYEGLVDACVFLCANTPERLELAQRGHALFAAQPQEEILKGILTH